MRACRLCSRRTLNNCGVPQRAPGAPIHRAVTTGASKTTWLPYRDRYARTPSSAASSLLSATTSQLWPPFHSHQRSKRRVCRTCGRSPTSARRMVTSEFGRATAACGQFRVSSVLYGHDDCIACTFGTAVRAVQPPVPLCRRPLCFSLLLALAVCARFLRAHTTDTTGVERASRRPFISHGMSYAPS